MGKTYEYNDGWVRTGKRGQYTLTKTYRDGSTVTAQELEPAPFQRNKSFNQRAWIVMRTDSDLIELWSYNTLVMTFNAEERVFGYLDGYAPMGKYRSPDISKRDRETRYNTVTTRLHELAFLHKFGGMGEKLEDLVSYGFFSTYSQPAHTFCRFDSVTNDYVTAVMQ